LVEGPALPFRESLKLLTQQSEKVKDMDLLHYAMAKLEVFRTLRRDERAVTALEYGLIAALISVVIATTVVTIGTNLQTKFTAISTGISLTK